MDPTRREEFETFLAHKRRGGTPHDVGVSDGVWLGGLTDARDHEPFVFLGPRDWEEEGQLAFFRDHDEVERFIVRMREAAQRAWGPPRGG